MKNNNLFGSILLGVLLSILWTNCNNTPADYRTSFKDYQKMEESIVAFMPKIKADSFSLQTANHDFRTMEKKSVLRFDFTTNDLDCDSPDFVKGYPKMLSGVYAQLKNKKQYDLFEIKMNCNTGIKVTQVKRETIEDKYLSN